MTNPTVLNELSERLGAVKKKIARRSASIDRLYAEIARHELSARFAPEPSERRAAKDKVDRRTKTIARLREERSDLEAMRSRIAEAISIFIHKGNATPEPTDAGQ